MKWFSPVPSRGTCIIVRTKDRPLFLTRAIRGILAQSDPDWVLAIVNDGGDKALLDRTLAPFGDELRDRLHLIHFAESEGRGKGKHLNAAIHATRSEFVAIHDDDDSWHPSFLTRAKEAMGEKNATVTQSMLVKERIENGQIAEISRTLYEPWQKHEISLFRLAESLSFPPIALLFRRSVLREIGLFRDELGPLEDWEFSLRLFAHGPVEFLEEPLACYHQREGAGAGPEANSFLNAQKIYGKLDRQIRNELLREDLRRGRLGLGYLVNLSDRLGHMIRKLEE